MKTLVLLSFLVLLAFQVQADPIQKADEETKTEEQLGKQDQDMSVFLGGPEDSAVQDAVLRRMKCVCRRGSCSNREYMIGPCLINGIRSVHCCAKHRNQRKQDNYML